MLLNSKVAIIPFGALWVRGCNSFIGICMGYFRTIAGRPEQTAYGVHKGVHKDPVGLESAKLNHRIKTFTIISTNR